MGWEDEKIPDNNSVKPNRHLLHAYLSSVISLNTNVNLLKSISII